MLKMTGIEMKLVTDLNMYLMIEKGIKGGRFEPIYHYAKANNEYINPNFDKKNDIESHYFSLDTNALYSTDMCYKLPFSEPKFHRVSTKYTIEYIKNLDPSGKYCYTFVVDIHY